MKELIEDYKRRLATIKVMIDEFNSNGSTRDIRKEERFNTKASEYRSIIAELERWEYNNSSLYRDEKSNKCPEENLGFVIFDNKAKLFLAKNSNYFTDRINNAITFTNKEDAEKAMNHYIFIYERTIRKETTENLEILTIEIRIV